MKRVVMAAVTGAAIVRLVRAGQEKGQDKGHQGMGPSKEHGMLKEMEGNWDVEMKFQMPGADEQTAKGTETVVLVGELWAVFDVKFDDMMGGKWQGHGTLGFDPVKKKYVGSFVHSASPFLSIGEGTPNEGGKSVTMNWDGVGPTGEREKMREVFEKKDKDNAVMTMYGTGSDGKEEKHFTMTYKRKK